MTEPMASESVAEENGVSQEMQLVVANGNSEEASTAEGTDAQNETEDMDAQNDNSEAATGTDAQARKKERKRRRTSKWDVVQDPPKQQVYMDTKWGPESQKITIPDYVAPVTRGLSNQATEAFLLRLQLEQVIADLKNPERVVDQLPPGARSPSPEPQYDTKGMRTNTRVQRMHGKLNERKKLLIEAAVALVPEFKASMAKPRTKLEKRIMVPYKKYPDYNFQGALIGPRGMNQKRLEKETGCKIAIRGRGTRKKVGYEAASGMDLDMHVYITADTEEKMKAGIEAVHKILTPVSEAERVRALKEVAMINGVWREEKPCTICGERGHKIYDCPKKQSTSWTPANVTCAICGDKTHPAVDCPRRDAALGGQVGQQPPMNLTGEYDSFMAELFAESEGGPPSVPASSPIPTPPPTAPPPNSVPVIPTIPVTAPQPVAPPGAILPLPPGARPANPYAAPPPPPQPAHQGYPHHRPPVPPPTYQSTGVFFDSRYGGPPPSATPAAPPPAYHHYGAPPPPRPHYGQPYPPAHGQPVYGGPPQYGRAPPPPGALLHGPALHQPQPPMGPPPPQ
eukprot:g54578.t1